MEEKKYVTWEAFEEYHKKLMEYIGMHDDLMLNGETTCPKCGATITSDKCERCNNIDNEQKVVPPSGKFLPEATKSGDVFLLEY